MKFLPRALGLLSVGALSLTALAACSPAAKDTSESESESGQASAPSDEKVVLSVVSLLPGSTEEAIAAFNEEVERFEAENPNIDVEPQEYEWKATTFTAQLAGGTLPDVFEIPFTDAKGLVQNGQLADMNAQFESLPYADKFNPEILSAGKGEDGNVYAIPAKNAYPIALTYNRTLFESAGLDPDQPPTSWDQVREYAKKIADANPGVAGYATMTQNNTGGWQLTAQTYSRGGRVQETEGEDKVVSTVDNDATKATLEYFKALRWEDNSMGQNFLLDWGSINQAFAAGEIGMFTSGSDIYSALVQANSIDPTIYGLAPIPLEGSDAAVLTGGTLAGVPADATDEIKDAAIKWIAFHYLDALVDKDAAVQNAETLAANNQPVGTPVLPMFSQAQYEENMEWIKDYINVPLAQMEPFISQMFDLPLAGEPSRNTQDIYALMDPVVQAVLTDQNADIDALLKQVNEQAQALIDQS